MADRDLGPAARPVMVEQRLGGQDANAHTKTKKCRAERESVGRLTNSTRDSASLLAECIGREAEGGCLAQCRVQRANARRHCDTRWVELVEL